MNSCNIYELSHRYTNEMDAVERYYQKHHHHNDIVFVSHGNRMYTRAI